MTMTTSSAPHLREPTVAEAKPSVEKPAEKPAEKKPSRLGRAAESGDAGIQILVAKRDIHVSNGDAERVAELDAELAELGFTV